LCADEIVVYCSDETCIASKAFGQLLERNGYSHVLHFVGGLNDWEQAGYPVEGTRITITNYLCESVQSVRSVVYSAMVA
jgi:3-mercaptopyruvate sulfurtransferase SseA